MKQESIRIALDLLIVGLLIGSIFYFYTQKQTFELLTHDSCRLCEQKNNIICARTYGEQGVKIAYKYPELNLSGISLSNQS